MYMLSNDTKGYVFEGVVASDRPAVVKVMEFDEGSLQRIARDLLRTKQDITPFFKAHDRNPRFWGVCIHSILSGLNTEMAHEALCWAAQSDHVGFVSQLLRRDGINPAVNKNRPIRLAALHGQLQVVRRLLRDNRVDPNACGNQAYKQACRKYPQIAALLKPYLPGQNRHRR